MSEINPGESLPDAIVKGLLEENKELKEQLKRSMDHVNRILPIAEKQSLDNKWLISDLKSMKKSFALANNWRNEHLEDSKKLKKIEKLINQHNGSDSHARTLFDEIDLMFE